MNNSLSLPEHEVVISSVRCTDTSVIFRVVEDYHPAATSTAYEISIIEPSNQLAATSFLEQCQQKGESVYVGIENCSLSIQTYNGEEIEIVAQSVLVKQDSFNLAELHTLLEKVWEWYELEQQSHTIARRRIRAAQQILAESARRIEIKAASHESNSTVEILYSQQLSLIQRLRDTLED